MTHVGLPATLELFAARGLVYFFDYLTLRKSLSHAISENLRSMSNTTSPKVIITGAGPAGAVLAFLLSRAGISTTLIERHKDFSREFRGELLMPSGLEPLHQIGLWEDFEKVGQVEIERFRIFINRKPFVTPLVNPAKVAKRSPRWVSQPQLLEMLVKKAADFPNFTLLRGTRVKNMLQENEHVIGVTTDTHGKLRSDLVVGCDGRTSIVRTKSGIQSQADTLPMDIVWLKLRCQPRNVTHSVHFYIGRGRLVIVAPTYDGCVQVGFIIPKGSFKTLRELGTKALVELITRYLDAEVAETLLSADFSDARPFLLSTVADRADEWSRPGMLLLGDAAHTMSPVGGQGLNIAIRDAIVAANHLIPALEKPVDTDGLLAVCQGIERERMNEVVPIQTMQARGPKIMLNESIWIRAAFSVAQKIGSGREIDASFDPNFQQMLMGVTSVRWQTEI